MPIVPTRHGFRASAVDVLHINDCNWSVGVRSNLGGSTISGTPTAPPFLSVCAVICVKTVTDNNNVNSPVGAAGGSPPHVAGSIKSETSAALGGVLLRRYTTAVYSLLLLAAESPLHLLAAASWHLILRACNDRSAGTHDGVRGSSASGAWRSAPRPALLAPVVQFLDATVMPLCRPGSGTRTPDTVGKNPRAGFNVPGHTTCATASDGGGRRAGAGTICGASMPARGCHGADGNESA